MKRIDNNILLSWFVESINCGKQSKVDVADPLYLRETEDVFLADSPFPLRKKVLLSQVSYSSSAKLLPDTNTNTRNAGNGTEKCEHPLLFCLTRIQLLLSGS